MGAERWLIAGLGNPGAAYEGTRHNIGFQVIHRLAKSSGLNGKEESRFKAIVATGFLDWDPNRNYPVILAQPLTYMNLSGRALQKIMAYFEIPPERLVVIYDERAIPLGKIRIRSKGRAAGHNGIKSIIEALGGNEMFGRIRVGIGDPVGSQSMTSHVLSRFTADELPIIEEAIELSCKAVETILQEGISTAMSRYNGVTAGEKSERNSAGKRAETGSIDTNPPQTT